MVHGGTTFENTSRMSKAKVIHRRYFRITRFAFSDDVQWIMDDIEKSGINCFTSTDYDNAFSLYCMSNSQRSQFKYHFDFVCIETEENKSEIDRIELDYFRKVVEIVGAEREHIEKMVDDLLDLVHTSGIKTQSLPSAMADETLRPYQSEMKGRIIEAWQRMPRIMLQMPTGTGKTRLFVSLINDLHKNDVTVRILIVTHRRELVEQTSRTLSSYYHLPHGIVGSKHDDDNTILIASIQKLSRMKELPSIDYIIIDEAHHCLAPSYKKLIARYPSARILGVTATPCRLKAASFKDIFNTLLLSPPVRRFINAGYLADYRLFTISDRCASISKVNRLTKFGSDGDYKVQDLQGIVNVDSEIEQLYTYYKEYANGRQGIIYAVSLDHAVRIAALFNAKGIPTVSLDCNTPAAERDRLVNAFRSGNSLKIMVNVELFTEGFDCPDIEFVMLARPTRSLSMYLQQVGRALRPSSNGSKVIILDAAGLYNRFGLPERKRAWQLYFIGEKPQGEDYRSRPLGTPDMGGLMKEVTATETNAQIVNTYGNYTICDFGGGKFGICNDRGRKVFPLFYDLISSYAAGWFVGKRQINGKETVIDILVPEQRSAHTFLDFTEEDNGIFSVGVLKDRRLRFDRDLRLIPTTSYKLGGKTIYQHGKDRTLCLYTLSLSLGSTLYTDLTRYVSGLVKLSDIWNEGITLLCRGEVFNLKDWNAYSPKHFYSMDGSLHIYTDGTVFRRITEHPVLYQATQDQGICLCDKQLHPLCQGDSMKTIPGGCTIYKGGKPLQTVSFVDYLCSGGILGRPSID